MSEDVMARGRSRLERKCSGTKWIFHTWTQEERVLDVAKRATQTKVGRVCRGYNAANVTV